MTEQHPITPPPELFKQWNKAALSPPDPFGYNEYIAIQAARWGADQELGACCEWLTDQCLHLDGSYLRADRRPQPPSLAEEALEQLNGIKSVFKAAYGGDLFDDILVPDSPIRRALERLQELEQN